MTVDYAFSTSVEGLGAIGITVTDTYSMLYFVAHEGSTIEIPMVPLKVSQSAYVENTILPRNSKHSRQNRYLNVTDPMVDLIVLCPTFDTKGDRRFQSTLSM